MTLEEMKEKKCEKGYSNEYLAEKSGVPLSTVQKVLSGRTRSPRRKTLRALENALTDGYIVPEPSGGTESALMEQLNRLENIWEFARRTGKSPETVCESPPAYAAAVNKKFTDEDIEALPDYIHAELIDGKIYYMAPPTRLHQKIIGELHVSIASYIRAHNRNCEVYESPFGVWLDQTRFTVVMPDLSIICDPDKLTDRGCFGAPDWIIEVLSPSNTSHDCLTKLFKYRSTDVKEYWIIHPKKRFVNVYVFSEFDGARVYSFDDEIPCSLYPDLKIRISDYV